MPLNRKCLAITWKRNIKTLLLPLMKVKTNSILLGLLITLRRSNSIWIQTKLRMGYKSQAKCPSKIKQAIIYSFSTKNQVLLNFLIYPQLKKFKISKLNKKKYQCLLIKSVRWIERGMKNQFEKKMRTQRQMKLWLLILHRSMDWCRKRICNKAHQWRVSTKPIKLNLRRVQWILRKLLYKLLRVTLSLWVDKM